MQLCIQPFIQFYRVEKFLATALGGSGLGLTIVKLILELHHGNIEIESECGSWVRVVSFCRFRLYQMPYIQIR